MRLACENLACGYGGHAVASGVTLALSAGETVCLLGPNGGGKTTLFKTLLGLLAPVAGHVRIDGTDIAQLPRSAVARRLGYVPQAQPGYFPYSVEEMVLLGRTAHLGLFARPSAADRAAALAALARLGIGHLAPRIYTEISGGERQLTLVARALAAEPQIIVMDEPTASLDFGNRARVLAQIAMLRAQGVGIVMSTHDPDQALAHADKVALLHEGTLAAYGVPQSVVTAQALSALYGIGVEIVAGTCRDGTRVSVCVAHQNRALTSK